MNDPGHSKHHLTPRRQLMLGHQLIKLLRLTRLAVMSAINSASSDQRFDHAHDSCHAPIKLFAIEILVRVLFLPTAPSYQDERKGRKEDKGGQGSETLHHGELVAIERRPCLATDAWKHTDCRENSKINQVSDRCPSVRSSARFE